MSLVITINGQDKTNKVEYNSLRIQNVLTNKVDTCKFNIKSYGDSKYTPNVGREVIITNNGTKVFGGIIVGVESANINNDLVLHKVECTDYTRLLDQKLVPDSYENQTAEAVIADIIANYAPAGFTTVNVDAPIPIDYIGFNYKTISKCLQELAELINYDWYVDYDKDIHFFAKEAVDAAIDIEDGNGSHIKQTLIIRKDNSQTRNSVVVRGGEYLGTEFTTEIECDGTRTIYDLPYKYTDFKATLTGNILNTGIDYINEADDYDALYNFNEKLLRFKDGDKPSATAVLRVSGKPNLPVIVKLKSQQHIDTMVSMEGGAGIYEHLIIDKSINSKEGARQRAEAEINAYANTLSEGEFITETDGLLAGQRIRVNSVSLGIDEYFIINKVVATQRTPDALEYEISLITTRTHDLVTVLQQLLLAETKKLEIKADEIIDLVEAFPAEIVSIADTVTAATEHNLQTETINIGVTTTVQSLDYDVIFVAGPYTWGGEGSGDTKRVFILNGSRLG